jgi:hypothetical protein
VIGFVDFNDVLDMNTSLKELYLLLVPTLDMYQIYLEIEKHLCSVLVIPTSDDLNEFTVQLVYQILDKNMM